jgi:Flp pilus assembly protein TadG
MMIKLRREQNGQALVEMALVIPLFFLLLFGVIEMGRIGHAYISVSNAARSGTRLATTGGTDLEIQNAVYNAAPTLNPSEITIKISPNQYYRKSSQGVTVQVTYPVKLIIPVLSNVVPNPVVVSSTLNMRLE